MKGPQVKSSLSSTPPAGQAEFVRNVYLHVLFAMLTVIAAEAVLVNSPIGDKLVDALFGKYEMFFLFALFTGVSLLADSWAHSEIPLVLQYIGFALYVLAEIVFLLPHLYLAAKLTSPMFIPIIASIALFLSVGIFAVACLAHIEFSWLRSILSLGGIMIFGISSTIIIYGVSLDLLLASLCILYFAGALLFKTAAIMRDYSADQHVAASLSLFASIMLPYWHKYNSN